MTERRYKKPIKPVIQESAPIVAVTGEITDPFIIFNKIDISCTFTIAANTELKENFYIVDGKVNIYYKDHLIWTLESGCITSSCFCLIGMHLPIKTVTACDCLVVKMAPGNPQINQFIFEKTFIDILSNFLKIHSKLAKLEIFSSKNFVSFLNLKSINEKIEKMIFHKESSWDVEDLLIWIEAGSLTINGVVFEKNAIFGYLGFMFNSCSKGFDIKTGRNTIVQYVKYTDATKRPPLDLALFKDISDMMVEIGLSSRWLRLPVNYTLIKKNTNCNEVYLIDNNQIGNKECILDTKYTEDMVLDKITDAIRIPKVTLENIFSKEFSFFKIFTKNIFFANLKRSKVLLITPADKNCPNFALRLHKILFADSILIKKKDITAILKLNISDRVTELLISNFLNKLKEKYKVIIVYVENEWSRLLKLLSTICDLVYIVGEEPIHNRFNRRSVEFVQIYESRTDNKKAFSKLKKLLFRNSDSDDSSELTADENIKKTDEIEFSIDPLGTENKASTKFERINSIKEFKRPSINNIETNCPSYRRIHHILCPIEENHCTKDFERLGRYLLDERYGLVLGGGGARGFAHIGVIRALEEENIPIDCIGGTSMGAFIGALYSSKLDLLEVYAKSKKFSKSASSIWNFLFDLTYPFVSLFSGFSLNRILKSTFKDLKIQNLWIEYYCVTTNLLMQVEGRHFNGCVWKYVRASMSICGYLPPFLVKDELLVDGAYMNNVPADVMKSLNVQTVIAVDVGGYPDTEIDSYDSNSGFLLLLKKYFSSKKYLSLADIQYRLAFLSTDRKIKALDSETLLIRPNLYNYKTSDFKNFDEIVACGYESAKIAIKEWKANGLISKQKKNSRRFSI